MTEEISIRPGFSMLCFRPTSLVFISSLALSTALAATPAPSHAQDDSRDEDAPSADSEAADLRIDPAEAARAAEPPPTGRTDTVALTDGDDDLPAHIRHGVSARQLRRGRILAASSVALLYTGLWTYNYFAWWHNEPLTPFQTEWDGFFSVDTYGGGADKMGHLYMNMVLSRATAGILRYGRFESLPASITGATLSWLSYLMVELRDGAHVYEFSWGDLLANSIGVGLGLLLTHVPVIDRFFSLRMMYWPSPEFRASPNLNFNEDYSGQTFLAALHLAGFGDRVGVFRYLDLVVGFNAEHYLPAPTDAGRPERQHLFFGFALNVQEILHQLFFRHDRSEDNRAQEMARGFFVDWAAEHFQIPFTAVPLVELQRTNR